MRRCQSPPPLFLSFLGTRSPLTIQFATVSYPRVSFQAVISQNEEELSFLHLPQTFFGEKWHKIDVLVNICIKCDLNNVIFDII